MICVFDCETVPDLDLLKECEKVAQSSILGCEEAFSLFEERTGSNFLPAPYHKIVSIAAVIADDFGNFKAIGNFPKDKKDPDEKEILSSFFEYIDKFSPKLITFNGRNFDLPTIFLRALKYNLSCPAFFDKNNPALNKTKWENYMQRFDESFHIDLLDSLSHFNFQKGLKLDVVCKLANIPGKYDTSGDEVYKLFYENRLEDIREYCESDALNTYWLYLKYELLKGNILLKDYYDIIANFKDKIPKDKSYSKVFIDYIYSELGQRS